MEKSSRSGKLINNMLITHLDNLRIIRPLFYNPDLTNISHSYLLKVRDTGLSV